MNNSRLVLGLLGGVALLLPACGGGNSGTAASVMDLEQVSNGFGQLLPHTAFRLDGSGSPTQSLISIRTLDQLVSNVTLTNQLQPVIQYPDTALLPSGELGNQFMYAEFTQDLDLATILDTSISAQAASNGLLGTITLVELNSTTGDASPVRARIFVNGMTFGTTEDPANPGHLLLEQWVRVDDDGNVLVNDARGLGFPGTESPFTGDERLISPRTIVFVADSDNDLASHDTFNSGRQLRMRITTAVGATNGRLLKRSALACTTVGTDTIRPEISKTPPPVNSPVITPGGGDVDVDPLTNVRVSFTEPVQPLSVGSLPTGNPPTQSAAIFIEFGPSSARVRVPFIATPVSVFDLSTYDLTPAFNFPGEGPSDLACGVFNRVDITVNPNQFRDLATNQNQLGASTFFTTGEGPGLVNAPVTPDTIYVGRSGAVPGLSVVDLNGFGQTTGDPTFDPTYATFEEGRTNFPNNPNVRLQGSLLRPALVPGVCTINGGSAGVFTLTRDSALNNLIVRAPIVNSITDMMIGHALDSVFNNGPAPFGCQSGGGNLCAIDGNKVISPAFTGANTMGPSAAGQFGSIGAGAENLAGWAPHPNPPPLVFPPICITPYIGGQEPTGVTTTVTNLLAPGDAFGAPLFGIPPSGLLTPEQNSFFIGPPPPQPSIAACLVFQLRQQVGQYLYVADRSRSEIVVLNSNRMTVIDRIETADPTTLAMSPNLNFLAVVNQISNTVAFIDIDPNSSTFHTLVHETVVGETPRGIAWDPGNEDLLVANELDSTLSIIAAASLQVRKTVSSQLDRPFDVAITPRQICWGFSRYVYFGYVMNRNGRLAVYESGPNSVNGWGYDDIVGILPFEFRNPKTMQVDQIDLRSAMIVAHEGPIDLTNSQPGEFGIPAVSKVVAASGLTGLLPLNFTSLLIPQFRDISYAITYSLGPDRLSGLPVDVAFDNLRNLSGTPNFYSPFGAGAPLPFNGKTVTRGGCPGVFNASEPRYMFVAVPNATAGEGVVDVILFDGTYGRVDTNPFQVGIQSIDAPNVQVVMDYFRQ